MAQELAHTGLHRSCDVCVAGVCAGIAERHDFDPIVIRILAVLLSLVTFGLAAVVYVVLWVYLPQAPKPTVPYDITPERAESVAYGHLNCAPADDLGSNAADDPSRLPIIPRLAIAVGLMLLFFVVATSVAPIVSGTQWWQFWPLAFLIIGLCLIVIPVRTRYEAVWHAVGIVTTCFAASMLPMALGIFSWETFVYGFRYLWPLVAGGVVLFGLGIHRNMDVLVIVGAFCVAAFCLASLFFFAIPGDVGTLFINMPDGRSLRIAILA